MPTERISMRKLKEIMRLKFDARLTNRQIACSINISPATVSRYLTSIANKGVTWPQAQSMSEEELEGQVYNDSTVAQSKLAQYSAFDCAYIQTELKRKNVTKQLLWEEYCQQNPNNHYSYSQYCTIYREWNAKSDLVMRQMHIAGEKLFVDYCGHTIPLYCHGSEEVYANAQIFTAVLGASNYTFAEATLTQELANWVESHARAFDYFGGIPKVVVPDNLKSAISKACKYEPDINPTYHQLALHYNVAIIPARIYTPRDKAKAEVGVQVVQRWILARLRNHKFYALHELNAAIKLLLQDLNNRKFKKLPGTRASAFLEMDKPSLQPLPLDRYEYTEVKLARVHIDYHIQVHKRYYSVLLCAAYIGKKGCRSACN